LADDGSVRAHWQAIVGRLGSDGDEGLKRGVELARRLIVENGVTYNVYADPQGRDRPWVLDPLPLVLPPNEWATIEAGVAQRARVLNSLLADLYGQQKLIENGVVPAELAVGHPNFLWPCRHVVPRDGRWLHIYAADLARAPDGRWWVLADRTQTPSGAGYALENREIVERVFPDLLRELSVRPIDRFFGALREQMLAAADATSLAVVLTPGPFNETYFEHVYLARQLGLPLVQGADLTVRDATVYLKTLAGLRPVHSILRRLDDDYCDPVELRSDSALGVPGLLSAVRAGKVVLANALGTGVLESAAWQGFLPGASEWLTDEKLLLPSVATWWCGERPALEYVLAHLDELVIKNAFPNQRFEPVFGRDLSAKAKADLGARIRAHPHAYVAQERFKLSQAPSWRTSGNDGLTARSLSVRIYAIATQNGYAVLPGGLSRIASESSAEIVSTQRGGSSKDVWVLAPPTHTQTQAQGQTQVQAQGQIQAPNVLAAQKSVGQAITRHDELASRLGENLFWLGRYTERCEGKARLLRMTLAARSQSDAWVTAVAICRYMGVIVDDDFTAETYFDANNPLGLPADVQRLAWCATQSRSHLSAEHWRTINLLKRQLQDATTTPIEQREALDRLLLTVMALAGFVLDDMARDDGWRLLMLGRHLERLQFQCDLLRLRIAGEPAPTQTDLEWLLGINGSTVAYRARYMSAPRLTQTLELLIKDEENSRSLAFQHKTLRSVSAAISTSLHAPIDNALDEPLRAMSEIDLGALEGEGRGAVYARSVMSDALQAVSEAASQMGDRLSNRYFAHVRSELQVTEA
ncbi:MAG TPA: circularly permuted type 2 ATP-grasp protein, partial [Steroidobacteraceae bacterium]|nr:circularly permuted type 2 ATP-grasp protein [Steroidobacteraceae bacterium]